MDNNNFYDNTAFGEEPQKPFTEKSSEQSVKPQNFQNTNSVQNDIFSSSYVESNEPHEPQNINDISNSQNINNQSVNMQNGNNLNGFQNKTGYETEAYDQNAYGKPKFNNEQQEFKKPDFENYGQYPQNNYSSASNSNMNNDYSYPQYNSDYQYAQFAQQGNPQNGYQNYNTQPHYNTHPPVNNYGAPAGNIPPRYGTQMPYAPVPPAPKNKMRTGLIIIIVVLCTLLVSSIIGIAVYFVSNSSSTSNGQDAQGGYSFTIPGYTVPGYTIPQSGEAAPQTNHESSDYSDKINPDFKGITLQSKPKDAATNKSYTAESAFNMVSDSVVGIVCYSDEITTVENCSSQGSGIIITSDGYIITNAHVIGNSKTLYLIQVVTSDGKTYDAGVVGFDSRTDIAVLKIDGAKNMKAAYFGDSEKIELGEDIIAVGNPGGLDYQNSITKGIVSAVNRDLSSTSLVKYIQTDAAINPGNSGGPIVNLYGQVIGVATSKIVSEKYEGMGFAIPSATVKSIADNLIKDGYIKGRVKIGISGNAVNASAASSYNIPQGILVQQITEGGPCDGTELKTGDIITEADGQTVASFSDIYEILETHKSGDKIKLKYYRVSDGSEGEFEVTLQEDK